MTTEAEERAAVIAEARTWLGTKYVSNAAVKGAGVDCGMILVKVFADLGLIEPFDPRPYPAQWALHQRAELYLALIERFADEVSEPLPGDVVLFQFGHCWSHGAIVVDWPEILHANPPVCRLDNWERNTNLRKRRPRFFSLWVRRAAVG